MEEAFDFCLNPQIPLLKPGKKKFNNLRLPLALSMQPLPHPQRQEVKGSNPAGVTLGFSESRPTPLHPPASTEDTHRRHVSV